MLYYDICACIICALEIEVEAQYIIHCDCKQVVLPAE